MTQSFQEVIRRTLASSTCACVSSLSCGGCHSATCIVQQECAPITFCICSVTHQLSGDLRFASWWGKGCYVFKQSMEFSSALLARPSHHNFLFISWKWMALTYWSCCLQCERTVIIQKVYEGLKLTSSKLVTTFTLCFKVHLSNSLLRIDSHICKLSF